MQFNEFGDLHIEATTELPISRLIPLFEALAAVIMNELPGDVAEFGVYRGSTSKGIANLLSRVGSDKHIHMFDTFSGLPDPDPEDLGDTLFDEWLHWERYNASERVVEKIMQGHEARYTTYKGFFGDFSDFKKPLCFAHIDADMFAGTRDAIQICNRVMVPKGVIVVDDYGTTWKGVTEAVDRYLDPKIWATTRNSQSQQFIAVRD